MAIAARTLYVRPSGLWRSYSMMGESKLRHRRSTPNPAGMHIMAEGWPERDWWEATRLLPDMTCPTS
jgi:hypothetical protein